jgi:hypothetical protein
MRTNVTKRPTPRRWITPALEFKGTVGEILQTGGGKLSVTGGDPGEMRCEKGINPQPC